MSVLSLPRSVAAPSLSGPAVVPPLENGDRLSRHEFHRRYSAMPEHVRAELIEGVVVMASPVRFRKHGHQHFRLIAALGQYEVGTPGVLGGDNATVQLDLDNEPQPDVCLVIDPARGGAVQFDAEGYIVGAPEFVAEIASSSVSQDLGPKLNAYRRNGVREYFVWRVRDDAIDWFALRDGRFDRLEPAADGVTRSEVFPGLWLDTAALIAGDMPWVHAVLRDGLADPAHAAFAASLAG
jgi:Uma2 family endonuclease